MLEDKIHHSWVDPRQYKDEQSLTYNYTLAWALANAAQEILDWAVDMGEQEQYLLKKEKGEVTNPYRL